MTTWSKFVANRALAMSLAVVALAALTSTALMIQSVAATDSRSETSMFEQEILADGLVTVSEMTRAGQRYFECIASLGVAGSLHFDVDRHTLSFLYELKEAAPLDPILSSDQGDLCHRRYLDGLEHIHGSQYAATPDPSDQDVFREYVAECSSLPRDASGRAIAARFKESPNRVATCYDSAYQAYVPRDEAR